MGYLWEVLLYILKDKGFINRGELRGPWIFVYGLGGVIILIDTVLNFNFYFYSFYYVYVVMWHFRVYCFFNRRNYF